MLKSHQKGAVFDVYTFFFHSYYNWLLETGAGGRGVQILALVFWEGTTSPQTDPSILFFPKQHLSQQRKPSGCSAFSKAYCSNKTLLRATMGYHIQPKLINVTEVCQSTLL